MNDSHDEGGGQAAGPMWEGFAKTVRLCLKWGSLAGGGLLIWYVLAWWMNVEASRSSASRQTMLSDVDWNEQGMDPTVPGFKPEVLVLAGDVRGDGRKGHFVITTRGADLYHRREWNNSTWWWWRLEMVCTNFVGQRSIRWKGHGSGGGGGSHYGKVGLVVARRLWAGANFVGALEHELIREDPEWRHVEQFTDLEQRGPFKIPRKTVFKDHNGQRTYWVRKVEFRQDPPSEWFHLQASNHLLWSAERARSLPASTGSQAFQPR